MTISDLIIEALGIRGSVKFVKSFIREYQYTQTYAEALFKGQTKKATKMEIFKAFLNTVASTKLILEDMQPHQNGYYNHEKQILALNKNKIKASTIAHEITHGVQYRLGYDFEKYVSYNDSNDDYEAYSNQLTEYEAFMCGHKMKSHAIEIKSYIRRQIKKGLAI